MTDKLLPSLVKLPYTHRGGAPYIPVVRLHDITHRLVSQSVAIPEALRLLVPGVVTEQALIRPDEDVPLFRLAKRVAHHAVQQAVPAIGTEAVLLRVITRRA